MSNNNFCSNCGSRITGVSNFCAKCGQKLSSTVEQGINTEEKARIIHAQQTFNTVEPIIVRQAEQTMYTAEQAGSRQGTSNNQHKIILLSLLCVILLLIMVFSGIFMYKKWTAGEDSSSSSFIPGFVRKQEEPKRVEVKINQLDNQDFPLIRLYVSVTDESGEFISNIPLEHFTILENSDRSNEYTKQTIRMANLLEVSEALSINLVMDTSGSMSEGFRLRDAKMAAKNFISIVKDRDELAILEFNDYVRTKSNFTSDKNALMTAIDQLYADGQTALFDAIYTALIQTSQKQGSKCVIVFTDGVNNKGTKSKADVIELAKRTGIPVYTIGIGADIESDLTDIALETGGYHVDAPSASDLEWIYNNIFKLQKNQYVITYTSSNPKTNRDWRNIELSVSNNKRYTGSTTREFVSEVVKMNLITVDEGRIKDIIRNNSIYGNYSVALMDLSSGGGIITGDYRQRMPASALMNVPITLAVADMIRDGRLSLDTRLSFIYSVGGRGKLDRSNHGRLYTVDELLQVMMKYSDNNVTNTFLSYIGIDEVNRIMRKYGFTETLIQAPMLKTSSAKENWTTCEEISRMLGLLYSDSLPIGSAYMNANFRIEDATKNSGILKYLPRGLNVIHHNGIRSDLYNEIAFIGSARGGKTYILTIMGTNAPQERLAEGAARISEYIYEEMNRY